MCGGVLFRKLNLRSQLPYQTGNSMWCIYGGLQHRLSPSLSSAKALPIGSSTGTLPAWTGTKSASGLGKIFPTGTRALNPCWPLNKQFTEDGVKTLCVFCETRHADTEGKRSIPWFMSVQHVFNFAIIN